jgi:hypothetical protein
MANPCSPTDARPRGGEDCAETRDGTPPLLWAFWALSVIGAAVWVWSDAAAAGRPLDLIFLVVRCTLVGLAGLLALTLIEMRLAPWRFLD